MEATYSDKNNRIIIRFEYNVGKIELVKNLGCRWEPKGKYWWLPYSLENAGLVFKNKIEVLPPLATKVREQVRYIEESSNWAIKTVKAHNFVTPPFHHQFEALQFSLSKDSCGYFMEMGTGKTKIALDNFNIRKLAGQVDKCLILCPTTIVNVWVSELKKHLNSRDYTLLVGCKKGERLDRLENDEATFYILNYEGLLVIGEQLLKTTDNSWFIIADEVTKIKNPQAKRTKFTMKLGKLAKYKVGLTGTPVTQSILDLWSICKFLDREILASFAGSYTAFKNRLCIMGGFEKKQVVAFKSKEVEILRETVNPHVYIIKSNEALPDLPEQRYIEQPLEMKGEVKRVYDEMTKELLAEYDGEPMVARSAGVKFLRLNQITHGLFIPSDQPGVTRYLKDNVKLSRLMEMLEDNQEQSLIVITPFIASIKLIEKQIMELGLPFVTIFGEVPQISHVPRSKLGVVYKQYLEDPNRHRAMLGRNQLIEIFDTNPRAPIMIGNAATMGMGLNLVRSNKIIYYGNEPSVDNRAQSEKRIHRSGQTKRCTYFDLVYAKSIDVSIRKIHKEGMNMLNFFMSKDPKKNKVTFSQIIKGEWQNE